MNQAGRVSVRPDISTMTSTKKINIPAELDGYISGTPDETGKFIDGDPKACVTVSRNPSRTGFIPASEIRDRNEAHGTDHTDDDETIKAQ